MIEIKIPQDIIKHYFEKLEGKPIKLIEYTKLGSGWHGTGYKLTYKINSKKKTVILRTLRPYEFSHDYKADRAKVFILQHTIAKNIPKHISSLDVIGYTKDKELLSIGDCEEFFQVVELTEGSSYMSDLDRILKGYLLEADREKVKTLANYLVELHKLKFSGPKELRDSIYKRHTRDVIGHGEMLMGVLDTYPQLNWATKDDIISILHLAIICREEIKHLSHRLTRIHGDFHPGNIIFTNKDFKVLDASREEFGEPADDLTALAINYIWYAIKQTGSISGPFKELLKIFWNTYIEKTKDYEINKIVPIFFAFRAIVVAHPIFYPNQDDTVRKKLFDFAKHLLNSKRFELT